ncbi:PREDICTED: gastrula zinc finger protein XlCGF26.1-like [Nicrophorus vespilloides]|uniref:Gastrula zinc finger protein XlCGF26.1-like n=1 Tax=Nicrophorus vespilloides TaxID=110193 RepID=A0ABM1MT96_NICVS|nr:PREDICTED: gastrula zinc finger protein XlCGF26.1-like [Nicrophorus vespilloides]
MSLIKPNDRCRACLNESIPLVELNASVSLCDKEMLLIELLSNTASIEIFSNDGKPQSICIHCITDARTCYNFRKRCQDSDVLLQQELDNCTEDNATNILINQSKVSTELLQMNIVKSEHEEKFFEEDTKNMKDDSIDDTEESSSVKDEVLSEEEVKHIIEDHMVTIPHNFDGKEVGSDLNFESHLQKGKRVFHCVVCGKIFNTRRHYTKHKRIHEQCSCDHCDYFNVNPVLVRRHKISVHADMRNFDCTVCSEKFFNETELKIHMKCHACFQDNLEDKNNPELGGNSDEYGPIESRTCSECGKIFKCRSDMVKHLKQHKVLENNSKRGICEYCDFISETSYMLFKHKETVHDDQRKAVCEECGKRFFTEQRLRAHTKIHKEVKEFVCEVCGWAFRDYCNMKMHMRVHTGDKRYKCDHCSKSFCQSNTLKSHLRSHSDVRDHICSKCGKGFKAKKDLNLHYMRHEKIKPYKCTLCDSRFLTKNERSRHLEIHAGVRNFKCEVCGKAFGKKYTLDVHMRVHTKETPYICPVCNKGFTQAQSLRVHSKTHASKDNKDN